MIRNDYAPVRATEELPGPLRLRSAFPFVGRSAELDVLRSLVPSEAGQGRRMALVGGEAGSGKSRLVRELAHDVATEITILYGACDTVVRTPYEPFVEALDPLTRVADPAFVPAALGAAGSELTRLLPGLSSRIGGPPPTPPADPDTERHRLHTAVVELLTVVSRERPILLVLEDCHWADGATLLLLRHLARSAADARLLVLATFRDTEAEVPTVLAETLAELRRSDEVVRLRLDGLRADDVAAFVDQALGGGLSEPAELGRAIHELTAGNAFLVCELWRALVETGALEVVDGAVHVRRTPVELGSPESVREVVGQRLSRLDDRTRDLLDLAATAGSEVDVGVVGRAARLDESSLVRALDDAVASGMLEDVPGRRPAYRFTHELVRRAVYDRLSSLRRAELHLRVAESLENAAPPSDRPLADLAYHFAAAAPFGGETRAVAYNVAAARQAASALAFDEAAERLRTALELGIADPEERGSALLELGLACHRGGKAVDALEAFTAAAAIARGISDPELLAQAAIGYEEACWRPGIPAPGAVELLAEGARALDPAPSALRVRLLAGLARALGRDGDTVGGSAARDAAIAMARELDDRAGLATVLTRSYWSRGATSLQEILSMLTEASELARELGDVELLGETMAWRVPTFVALCDLDAARSEVAAQLATAQRTGQPFMHHVADHYGAALALGDGRLADAETLARRSHEWSRMLTGRDASGVYGVQMFSIRREQGRLAELAPAVRTLAGEETPGGAWEPGLVAVLAELGLETEARRALARIAKDGLEPFRESLWLASLVYLAEASAALGDETVGELVYSELTAYAGHNVMVGHLVAYYGAADRFLGMLAACLGDGDAAAVHFEAALALNRRMGAVTWTAHTAYEYGRLLLARGRAQRAQAEALLGEAAALADRIGMPTLEVKIRALGAAALPVALPDGLSPRELQVLALVARGLSNREIGAELTISEHTAANHVRSILQKTGSSNRTEAASYAHRHRLVPA
jgi:DNA-binding CsgD family transcriptional regulator